MFFPKYKKKYHLYFIRKFLLCILLLLNSFLFSCTKPGSGKDNGDDIDVSKTPTPKPSKTASANATSTPVVDVTPTAIPNTPANKSCNAIGLNILNLSKFFDLIPSYQKNETYNKIINGTECEPGESPVVRILIESADGEFTCTGTVIAPNIILTASHCYDDTVVSAGVSGGFGFSKVANVKDVKIHPKANLQQATGRLSYDVAIFRLDRQINLPSMPILTSEELKNGDTIYISGYGLANDKSSGRIRAGQMAVSEISDDGIFARFFASDSNTCSGDSGGPAILEVNGKKGIVGITSSGERENCEVGDISFFANAQDPIVTNFIKSNAPGVSIK